MGNPILQDVLVTPVRTRDHSKHRASHVNRIRNARRWGLSFHVVGVTLLLGAVIMQGWSVQAVAGVTPEVSRLVFAAGAVEQSLQVFNVNEYPVLVQAWIDDGRIDALPQESTAPIVVIPPIFRLGHSDQTNLRLINSGAALPSDRESLFWLNLYEIPATPKNSPADNQMVTVTMRTQIKVFVRPAKLPFSSDELPRRLAFLLTRTPDGLLLEIRNPTPYYATIAALQVGIGSASQEPSADMIAPFSKTTVHLDEGQDSLSDNATVRFLLISDDGNSVSGERKVVIEASSVGS